MQYILYILWQWLIILQSHYLNRRSADGRRAKFWKIGRRRHRFWLNFWSADDFFVEAPKLKVSLTDPPIFMGVVIGEASGDGRPMIGRRFKEINIMISAEGRPIIGRQSADDRQTVGRWVFIKESSADRRRYRPSFGRWSPDCRPIIKCWLCNIFYNTCIHIMYEIKSYINVILEFISMDLVYKYHLDIFCWILIDLSIWRFEIT